MRFASSALFVAGSLALAHPASAQDAMDRRVAERVGLNPAQARTLFARVDAQQSQINALARANRIPARTLRAIALELGARNPDLPPDQLLTNIRALAAEAAQAQARISELTLTIEALDPGGERSRAANLLAQAMAAFEEGRLEDAESAFAQLSFLRSSAMAQARAAWLSAIDLQAQSASLRGDTEGATQIRLAKMAEIRTQREAAARDEWATAIAIAADWIARGDRLGDNAALLRAIGYYRDLVLPLAPRDTMALEWAATQNDLGNALGQLGSREPGSARMEEAESAYRDALDVLRREQAPVFWATVQNNLGNVLLNLGEREPGTSRLEAAVTAFSLSLEERRRDVLPKEWAATQANLGNALQALGVRDGGTVQLQAAAAAYRMALQEQSREQTPLEWARSQNNLANTLGLIGAREASTERLEDAIAGYQQALLVWTRELAPLDWAAAQNNMGRILTSLGERQEGTVSLHRALAAFELALAERTRERVPLEWAATRSNMGFTLLTLASRETGTQRLEEAVRALSEASEIFLTQRSSFAWARTSLGLAAATAALAEQTGDSQQLVSARTILANVRTTSIAGGYPEVLAAADRMIALVDAASTPDN